MEAFTGVLDELPGPCLCHDGAFVKDESGNNVTLREYVERIFAEQEKESAAAKDAADKALKLATNNLEARLANLNELRAQVVSDRAEYVRRESFDSKVELLQEQLRNVEKRLAWIMGVGSLLVLLCGIGGTVLGWVLKGRL